MITTMQLRRRTDARQRIEDLIKTLRDLHHQQALIEARIKTVEQHAMANMRVLDCYHIDNEYGTITTDQTSVVIYRPRRS